VAVLALLIAALNALLSFTGMEARVQRHETAYRQYESLGNEIEKAIVTENLRGDDGSALRDLEKVVFERHDVVAANEPPISRCCQRPIRTRRFKAKRIPSVDLDDELAL